MSAVRRTASGPVLAFALVLALVLSAGLAAGVSGASAAHRGQALALTLAVLSSRPDTVSGGDALVEVTAPRGVPLRRIAVTAGRRDVTAAFRPAPAPAPAPASAPGPVPRRALRGLVTGLPEGTSVLAAAVREGAGRGSTGGGSTRRESTARPARLTVRNHPRTGPVFAGPHETPFLCDTADFELVAGGTLGPPLDRDCSAATRTDYVYRTTGGELRPLPEGVTRPGDLAWTTTSTGARVPYIVRVETGTVNRAIYETALLADPADPSPGPWRRSPGWNGRLVYTFGGGCPRGWYVQGRDTGGVTHDGLLRKGYAVASSSLNVFGNNCNDLLAAESMAMVKERFTEAYGPPSFTIGWGCSGGSYQAHQIGDNYPGLIDGALVGCSFPDVSFGTLHPATDAALLEHYFEETAPGTFSREQQRRVAGFGRWESIGVLARAADRIDPRVFCPERLPEEQRYDPVTNPGGARCDVYSHTANAYGRDPETGLAYRPLDNRGIEYGRGALTEGVISVEEFLDLNEGIGGFDADGNAVARRTAADPEAVEAAYRTGRLLNGGGGLAAMPVIDYRAYTDDNEGGDLHMRFQSFTTRERLKKANGTAANHVMLVEDDGDGGGDGDGDGDRERGFSAGNPVVARALAQLDAWLTALRADDGPGTALERVIRTRPPGLTDACFAREGGVRIAEPQQPGVGTTRCNTEYPVWSSPRMVAGAGLANDVIVCEREPVDAASYGVPMTEAQERRLRRIFPGGVCDWSRPGVGQRGPDGTWQFF